MLDERAPHEVTMTAYYAFNGLNFVPHYKEHDTFVAPGGYNVPGVFLRALGAVQQFRMLWPR